MITATVLQKTMSLRRLAPRFVDWRLSRIDEEIDRVSCCSSDATSPPSPPLPPPPPLLLDDDPAASDSSAAHDETSADEAPTAPPVTSAVIYSNADEWRKQQLERSGVDDEREALRFIREKYDSLGKLSVDKPSSHGSAATTAPQPVTYENVPSGRGGDVRNRSECAAVVEDVARNRLPDGSSEAVLRREPPKQSQNPPCQCHQHQQPPDAAEKQRQKLGGECMPRSPLTDAELFQIDLFYRSYKSSVYVCACMATLSFSRPIFAAPTKSKSTARRQEDADDGVWACVRTGIPVVVRDNSDGRRRTRVYVLLAERGTGFELWRAPLDRLSDYAVTTASLPGGDPSSSAAAAVSCSQHTMRLSIDDTMSVTARLVFDDQAPADEFHRQLVRLATAADGDATIPAVGGSRAAKKRRRKGVGSLSKADISQPCCFSHVTRLERGISCRGRPGLHIVVASGRQMSPSSAGAPATATPPPSSNARTAAPCHSSFKAKYI